MTLQEKYYIALNALYEIQQLTSNPHTSSFKGGCSSFLELVNNTSLEYLKILNSGTLH